MDAFARFSIATREIGATSDQVATLVGGLQRIAVAPGASQQEIASSTQQLAQALASGTLQGDELRSILEGPPTVVEAVLAAKADKVAEYCSGKDKLFVFLVGQTTKAKAGKGNSTQVKKVLKHELG